VIPPSNDEHFGNFVMLTQRTNTGSLCICISETKVNKNRQNCNLIYKVISTNLDNGFIQNGFSRAQKTTRNTQKHGGSCQEMFFFVVVGSRF
jgi:hypothetical protein